MGKLITILGGCLVVGGGISYGLYTSHYGCPLSGPAACPHAVAVESDCCNHDTQPVNTSAGDDGCPFAAAAKATCPGSTSAGGEDCCAASGKCPSNAGLTAVAGAALSAAGK